MIEQNIAVLFPLFFASLWLTVCTILAVLSGWFRLTTKFPNQAMEPILRVRWQSGSMGLGVIMSRILILGVCPSGLRVGIMRVFGPFCRDFFVPWEDIRITRRSVLFWPVAKLQFGSSAIGSLTISAHLANRLARAAMGHWPETGPFPEEGNRLDRLANGWWSKVKHFYRVDVRSGKGRVAAPRPNAPPRKLKQRSQDNEARRSQRSVCR